jgi:Protein of unknown function (DUF4199)
MEQRDAATSSLVTARSSGVRYGFFLGLVIVAYFLILTSLGIHVTEGFWLWFKYVFIIAAIYFAQRYFKYHNGALMEFGQGVSISARIGLIFGLMDACVRYVYLKFIDPSFIQKMQDIQVAEMQREGLSETEIKQAVGITSLFMNPEFVSFIVFISAVLGAIIVGLVLSIFTRNVFTRNS